jgi:hypothetical protein
LELFTALGKRLPGTCRIWLLSPHRRAANLRQHGYAPAQANAYVTKANLIHAFSQKRLPMAHMLMPAASTAPDADKLSAIHLL